MKPTTKGTDTRNQSVDKKMVDKVNQQMATEEDSLMAKIIGFGLILLGAAFIVLAVVVVVLSRRSAEIDESLEVPTLKANLYTNEEVTAVEGTTSPDGEVMFFIDGEESDVVATADSDGEFSAELTLPNEEGVYDIQAATVEGFPLRNRSKKSDISSITLDKTAPSAEAEFDYDPISQDGKFDLSGTVDPNAIVRLSAPDGVEYYTSANEDGKFNFEQIKLNAKDTEYNVTLVDEAGNERELALKLEVSYPAFVEPIASGDVNGDGVVDDADGDLNGDGVTTGDGTVAGVTDTPDLPEAAGELDAAMDILGGNTLMLILGLVAVAVFSLNSGVVAVKLGSKR